MSVGECDIRDKTVEATYEGGFDETCAPGKDERKRGCWVGFGECVGVGQCGVSLTCVVVRLMVAATHNNLQILVFYDLGA
jgi:hypothetical protein